MAAPHLSSRIRTAIAVALALATMVGAGLAVPAAPAAAAQAAAAQADWTVTAAPDPGTGAPRWRITWHPAEGVMVRSERGVITSDGRPVGYAVEAPDLRSISTTTTDPALVLGAPRFALTYGGYEVGASPPPARWTVPAAPEGVAVPPRPPALRVDPGVRGSYTVRRAAYDLGDTALQLRSLRAPVEMAGQVYWPAEAEGRRPVVLFLHGRHATCADGEWTMMMWPCPSGTKVIPNHLGYAGPASVLASHGYIVISVSANGVNAADGVLLDGGALARAQLVQAHLRQWREWGAGADGPFGGAFVDRLNFRNVGLMGHSRGGEGVIRAAQRNVASRTPFGIRAVLPLAPTSFQRLTLPGVALGVLLPQCDGDVFELAGQRYIDDARYAAAGDPAARSTMFVLGANHNYFNTEWTPGVASAPAVDDWEANWGTDYPECDPARPARLTAEEQRAVGRAYIAGFFRLHLGRERSLLGLLDGSGARAESAGRADVRVIGQSPQRKDLHRLASLDRITATGFTPQVCAGARLGLDQTGSPPCVTDFESSQVPHWGFTWMMPRSDTLRALSMRWDDAGDRMRIPVPRAQRSFAGLRALTLRAVANPQVGTADLRIRLFDTEGRAASVLASEVSRALIAPAGDRPPLPRVVLQQISIPLRHFAAIDLRRVAAVEIVGATPRGHVWLSDLAVQRAALSTANLNTLPALTITDVERQEGDAGPRAARFTITASHASSEPISMFVQGNLRPPEEDPTSTPYGPARRVTIPAGELQATIDLPISTNTVDDYDISYLVSMSRTTNAVAHRTWGWGTVIDDDPTPTLTIGDSAAREGRADAVRFSAQLSEPSGKPVVVFGQVHEGTATAGEDFADVFGIALELNPGDTAGRLALPIVDDELPEGPEIFTVDLNVGGATLVGSPTLTGTIRDND